MEFEILTEMRKTTVKMLICEALFILIIPLFIGLFYGIKFFLQAFSLPSGELQTKYAIIGGLNVAFCLFTGILPIIVCCAELSMLSGDLSQPTMTEEQNPNNQTGPQIISF